MTLGTGYSSYHYVVSTNSIKAKLETADWINASARVVNNLHGIQLIFAQSGGVRLPDVKTMLLTFVSGLVMLSTAKTIADYFLLYVAPKRADYRLFVEQLSPNFGGNDRARLLESVLARKREERQAMMGLGRDQAEAFLPQGSNSEESVPPPQPSRMNVQVISDLDRV